MFQNPHFRILALSATPGEDPERVQQIINNLHIDEVEIRGDDSIDIIQYTFKKVSPRAHEMM